VMLSAIAAAFPRRGLKLRAPLPGWTALYFLLVALALAGFGVHVVRSTGMPILEDVALLGRPLESVGRAEVKGQCRGYWMLLQDCDVTVKAWLKTGTVTRELSYMFFEPHQGNRTLAVLADPATPDRLTTDVGQDFLWNRAATFVIASLFACGITVALLASVWARLRARARAARLSGRVLQPVALRWLGYDELLGWRVTDATGEEQHWPLPRRPGPFLLNAERALVLAVTTEEDGAPVFPLDAALRWVALTEEERARLLVLRAAAMPPGPGAPMPPLVTPQAPGSVS
jgi:hypothetical protein